MALVHVLSTAPLYDPTSGAGSDELRRLRDAAAQDRFKVHKLTGDPREADLILFVDAARPDLKDIRNHALYRQYIEKCFVMHHGDGIFPFLPGIYTCPERGTHPASRSRTGSYLTVMENRAIRHSSEYGADPALYSFVGRADTSKVRTRLMNLRHPRAILIATSYATEPAGRSNSPALPQGQYCEIILQSRFVLCPRGLGSSSYRLFETLKAGRVPVIISDAWIPPEGPDWDRFAVFVRESQVDRIPQLLSTLEHRAIAMGQLARQAWEEWFSESSIFHRSVEWCLQLLRARLIPEKWGARLIHVRRLRPSMVARRLARLI